MGGGSIDDTAFLKITATVLIMVIIATMAQTDSNNPMAEIGIPFDANSFNIYALGNQAPQLPTVQVPTYDEDEKACWISWWCPDLPGDAVAKAITQGVVTIYGFITFVINGILWGGTIVVLLIINFLMIFNFVSWDAFQGNILLILFGVALTAILGGSIVLWIYAKVIGAIPFVGGV